jgi:hypothetical protein
MRDNNVMIVRFNPLFFLIKRSIYKTMKMLSDNEVKQDWNRSLVWNLFMITEIDLSVEIYSWL